MKIEPLRVNGEPGGAREQYPERNHATYRKYKLRGSLELRDLRQFHEIPYARSTRRAA